MKSLFYKIAGIAFLITMMVSCQDPDSNPSRLRIVLVDNLAAYEAVNVDIRGIRVHTDGQTDENTGGWVDIPDSDVGMVNLLDYTDGTELVLADTEFPVGKISQIRLLLGEENNVVVNGRSNALKTPSAQQSGLKLQVHEILTEGVTYTLKLDFDAARSIVRTGNEKFILKPVIRVITEAIKGGIKGVVEPAEENVAIYVIQNGDTLTSTYAPADISNFLITGIESGTYAVSFDPGEDSQYTGTLVENVSVSNDDVTDMGEIKLKMKK